MEKVVIARRRVPAGRGWRAIQALQEVYEGLWLRCSVVNDACTVHVTVPHGRGLIAGAALPLVVRSISVVCHTLWTCNLSDHIRRQDRISAVERSVLSSQRPM